VVLLHGLTESGRTWPDAVDRWGRRWRLLAVDLRGHGESPRFSPAQVRDAPAVMLADVLGVLDACSAPVVLVGHSLGALLALRAAWHDRVVALVLEDPARPGGDDLPDPDFVRHQEDFLERMLRPATEIAAMRASSTWSDAEIDAWAASKPQVDRRFIRHGLSLGDGRFEELFNTVTVPTLLIVPEGSEMAPADADITNPLVRIARIPGASHCVRRDLPDRYHAAVDPFLRSRFEATTTPNGRRQRR
jgi:pimeloyl-ACP methyl ester carboxylesterase